MRRLFHKWFGMYRGLPRSVYVLFFARIVNSAGNFVFPFLTMFLTDRLGIPTGEAGLYMLVSAFSFVPGSLIGGKLADHVGRKRVMLAAQFLGGLCFVPCAFLGDSMVIIYLIIGAQFCYGAVHPCHQAMVTDISTPETRKAAFSLQYLGINLGFAVGPIVAGYLYANNITLLFLGDVVTTMIAVALVFLFVGESKPSEQEIIDGFADTGNERSERKGLFPALAARPLLLAFVFIVAILNFVYAQFHFSIPLFNMELFGSVRGPRIYGLIMSTNAVVVIAFTALIISVTRNLRPILNVSIAGLCYAVGFGSLFFARTVPFFLASTLVWTVGEILSATNINVYIANHTPKSHRGRFNSIFPVIMGTGNAISPAIVGGFIERAGIAMVWPLSAALACVGSGGLFLLWKIENRTRRVCAADAATGEE